MLHRTYLSPITSFKFTLVTHITYVKTYQVYTNVKECALGNIPASIMIFYSSMRNIRQNLIPLLGLNINETFSFLHTKFIRLWLMIPYPVIFYRHLCIVACNTVYQYGLSYDIYVISCNHHLTIKCNNDVYGHSAGLHIF